MEKSKPEKEIKLIEHDKVPGLFYAENIMTNEEENEIISEINKNEWLDDLSRRVQHYGYKYDYKKRRIDKNDYLGELPIWTKNLENKIFNLINKSDIEIIYYHFDQLIINEYKSNQGISAHVDCVPCLQRFGF
jgi:alkylated DNA repair dioxygenase AlkB